MQYILSESHLEEEGKFCDWLSPNRLKGSYQNWTAEGLTTSLGSGKYFPQIFGLLCLFLEIINFIPKLISGVYVDSKIEYSIAKGIEKHLIFIF